MNILHLPIEIANQINVTSKALQNLNHNSRCANYGHKFNYEKDLIISDKSNRFLRLIDEILFFFKIVLKYDVFHYHKDYLLPFGLDIIILKLLKKKIFIEFWGSEIRLYDLERKRNKFFQTDNQHNQQKKLKRLKFWSKVTDTVIVSDHSMDVFLKPFFKKICVIGQRLEISKFTPNYPKLDTKKPLIVHAPSSKKVKGTEYVVNAIEILKKEGYQFEYIEIFDMTHDEALEVYINADIVIDQLLIGSYGILACECMALGKPVICYILDENINTYDSLFPIVNANPENIINILKSLIESPKKRNLIGKQSRIYAEKVHDSRVVAEKLLNIYNNNN